MLNEVELEKYIYRFAKRQEEYNAYITNLICSRVRDIGTLASFDDVNSIKQVARTNEDVQNILRTTKQYQREQEDDMEDMLLELAIIIYEELMLEDDNIPAFKNNRLVTSEVVPIIRDAKNLMAELTKHPKIKIRDLAKPGVYKYYTPEQAYNSVVTESNSYINLPDSAFLDSIKPTINQLLNNGMVFDVGDKLVNAITSLRGTVLDKMRSIISTVDNILAKQFNFKYVDLSAHIYPAPDHAPAQGHRFTKEEIDKMQSAQSFQDIDGHFYVGFVRKIGTWNCRHYFKSVSGKTPPQYTQEQLDKILRDNDKGYTTIKGEHYTMYECTQVQRGYERAIRKSKEKYLVAKALGDKVGMTTARNSVGNYDRQYRAFSNSCGLPYMKERVNVTGY